MWAWRDVILSQSDPTPPLGRSRETVLILILTCVKAALCMPSS